MKKIFIAVMIVTLVSCEGPNVESKETKYLIGNVEGRPLEIVEIEGCEYFFAEYDRSAIFEHKGNCNNPIHGQNKSKDNDGK